MNGRTVLITGASTGIGFELANLFAQDKWDLVLLARHRPQLMEVSEQLGHTYGVQTQIVVADLSHPRVPEEVIMQLNETGTKVACLVNNAGFGAYGDVHELPLETQMNMIQVNVASLVELTHRLLPHIITVRGRILNVASTAAFQPGPHMAAYYATKAFVLSFSEALAEELAPKGVHISTLCPGPVPTEFQKRAGMEGTPMMKGPLVVPANTVAREAYEGLMKGKRLIIPGWANKAGVQGQRLAPRRLVTKIAGALAKKKS
jgi:short-subunit dehydrogenase